MKQSLRGTDASCYGCDVTDSGEDYTVVAIVFGVIAGLLLLFGMCKLVIYLYKAGWCKKRELQTAAPHEVTGTV